MSSVAKALSFQNNTTSFDVLSTAHFLEDVAPRLLTVTLIVLPTYGDMSTPPVGGVVEASPLYHDVGASWTLITVPETV